MVLKAPQIKLALFTILLAVYVENTMATMVKTKGKGGELNERGKGEGSWENWEKVQVLWICRGAGVFPSRVIGDEYRI